MNRRVAIVLVLCMACGSEADAGAIGGGAIGGGGAASLYCGDSRVSATEACDDGNATNGDGCSAQCLTEVGYTCTGSPSSCFASVKILPPTGAYVYYRAQDRLDANLGSTNSSSVLELGQISSWRSEGSAASANLAQGVANAKPVLYEHCIGGRACAQFVGPGAQNLLMATGAFTSLVQPFTACVVAATKGGGTRAVFSDTANVIWGGTNWGVSGADSPGAGVTGSVTHLDQFDVVCGVFNGASSAVYVNGTKTTGNAGGTSDFGVGALTFGARAGSLNCWNDYIAEFGVWSGSTVPQPFLNYARAYYGVTFPAAPSTTVSTVKIATLGDSITAGAGGATYSYPKQMQSWLGLYGPFTISNRGTSGWKVADMLTEWTTNIKGQGYSYLFFLGGVNDVMNNETAAQITPTIDQICQEARADTSGSPRGMVVKIATLTPWDAYVNWSAGRQTVTDTINTHIRSIASVCPGAVVVDAYASMASPTDAAALNPFYSSADGLHPNDAGLQDLAELFMHP